MIVGVKDGLKFFGISIVSAAAVFVCTFMLNFHIDVQAAEYAVTEQMRALYDAQIAMSKFVCIITGSVLGFIVAIMLIFYIKLYIDENAKSLALLKALGYSDGAIAARFWVFGLSAFIGCAAGLGAGFAAMPAVYRELTIEGLPDIAIGFHAVVPIVLVLCPTVVFTAVACGCAAVALHRPLMSMLRGNADAEKKKTQARRRRTAKNVRSHKEKPFLVEMCVKTVGAKKSLAFFVAFACFCFSSMLQMGASMIDMENDMMGIMILSIGIVLAAVITVMSATTLVNSNRKNVALMKAMGYSTGECALAVFTGYVPFALIGFAVGTVYQYGLLKLMIEVMFKDVAAMPTYSFDAGTMFIVFAAFVAAYAVAVAVFAHRLMRAPVKEVMTE